MRTEKAGEIGYWPAGTAAPPFVRPPPLVTYWKSSAWRGTIRRRRALPLEAGDPFRTMTNQNVDPYREIRRQAQRFLSDFDPNSPPLVL